MKGDAVRLTELSEGDERSFLTSKICIIGYTSDVCYQLLSSANKH